MPAGSARRQLDALQLTIVRSLAIVLTDVIQTVRNGFGVRPRGQLRAAAMAAQQPAPPPPMMQAQPPQYQSGPIEAGCSYNATQLPGQAGAIFQVMCPPGCQNTGSTWGTDVYTADSAICRTGIHAGALSPNGGVVTVRLDVGRPAYRGSMRNGISSSDYGQYGTSYEVLLPPGQAQAGPPPAAMPPQAIEAGCSFNSTQIHDGIGTAHLVSCPVNCAGQGGLWGTDVYTGDTAICRAAIHAGLLSNGGGMVVVVLDPGRPAYRGTVRNNERSSDYGSYGSSFHLQRP